LGNEPRLQIFKTLALSPCRRSKQFNLRETAAQSRVEVKVYLGSQPAKHYTRQAQLAGDHALHISTFEGAENSGFGGAPSQEQFRAFDRKAS
jgi:hypothetical protein